MPNNSSDSSQHEHLIRVSAGSMRGNPLGEDQKAVLVDMAAKQLAGDDSDIDYSDIPPPGRQPTRTGNQGQVSFRRLAFPHFPGAGCTRHTHGDRRPQRNGCERLGERRSEAGTRDRRRSSMIVPTACDLPGGVSGRWHIGDSQSRTASSSRWVRLSEHYYLHAF